jgi:hypothetical protein
MFKIILFYFCSQRNVFSFRKAIDIVGYIFCTIFIHENLRHESMTWTGEENSMWVCTCYRTYSLFFSGKNSTVRANFKVSTVLYVQITNMYVCLFSSCEQKMTPLWFFEINYCMHHASRRSKQNNWKTTSQDDIIWEIEGHLRCSFISALSFFSSASSTAN